MSLSRLAFYLVLIASSPSALHSQTTYGGVTFPAGNISFADQVAVYEPLWNLGGPTGDAATQQSATGFNDPLTALGPPNAVGTSSGYFVGIGHGGRLTVCFTDNVLVADGTPAADLHIFEEGTTPEGMSVEVSPNGSEWTSVGMLGKSQGDLDIDLDSFGCPTTARYRYVRITDDGVIDSTSNSRGVDIDAVGAISTLPVIQPNPVVTPLIQSGDTWSILDFGIAPDADWKLATYVEPEGATGWHSEPGPFGYSVLAGPPITYSKVVGGYVAATLLNFSPGNNLPNSKYITTYFRKTFELTNTDFSGMQLSASWDDGIVVYINGVEVRRENMPAGVIGNSTGASASIQPVPPIVKTYNFANSALNPFLIGTNVVAVELHQANNSSSDVYLDLKLEAIPAVPVFVEGKVGAGQIFEDGLSLGKVQNGENHCTYLREGSYRQMQYDVTYAPTDTTLGGANRPVLDPSTHAGDTKQLRLQGNTSCTLLTERLDARNFKDIQAGIQLRSLLAPTTTWDTSNYLKGSILTSIDGVHFTEIPWFKFQNLLTNATVIPETQTNFWQVPKISGATISDASNTNPILITTTANHQFLTGDSVTISGVHGNTAANGNFTVTKTAATTFTLNSTSGIGLAPSTYSVINASATTPIFITTSVAHPFMTGDTVIISGVSVNTAANGTFTITKSSATSFSLNGSIGATASTGSTGKVYAAKQYVLRQSPTTNPLDWLIFEPSGWTDFQTPPVASGLSNFWHAGNLPTTTVRGGIGYDDTPAVDFTPYLDAGSKSSLRADLFGKDSRVNLRIPFSLPVDISHIHKVELSLRYDDAAGAWLASDLNATTRNGVKLVSAGEPTADAEVPTTRSDITALEPVIYDVTTLFKANAMQGPRNVLCLRGYNAGVSSADLMLWSTLTLAVRDSGPGTLDFLETDGSMTSLTTPIGLIPDGTQYLKIKVESNLTGSSSNSYCFIDNLTTTGEPVAAQDLSSTLALALPAASYSADQRLSSADADGDGLNNLLEYAFVAPPGSGGQTVGTASALPTVTLNPEGRLEMRFRTLLDPLTPSVLTVAGELPINDISYIPEISTDGTHWEKNSFDLTATSDNGDGSQTVTVVTKQPVTTNLRAFCRIKVITTREPWINPPSPGQTVIFPE